MKILSKLDNFSSLDEPIALTLGNFDGVHLGHLAILRQLQKTAPHRMVITFSNHPKEVLLGNSPPRICTYSHKVDLFKKNGVDTLLNLPFTKELSQLSASEFLSKIKATIPFTHLILGDNARFGHRRDGTHKKINEIANDLGFSYEYLKPETYLNVPISSSRIRECVLAGDLDMTKELLGRPYSIRGAIVSGAGRGKRIGYPTANLKTKGLVLPPLGVYAVSVGKKIGIANLGVAPTFGGGGEPLLEVHVIGGGMVFDGEIEVVFGGYLREEKKFDSPEALKAQIAEDVRALDRF